MSNVTRIRGILCATGALFAFTGGSAAAATGTVTFSHPGEHPIVVPAGVTTLDVIAVGGRGGAGNYFVNGGFGARVVGELPVTPGSTLYLEVGGNGADGSPYGGGGAGGGASDVRTSLASAGLTPVDPRLLIAGGGGGSGRGYGNGAGGTAGIGGDAGMVGGNSRTSFVFSGGGGAGAPVGTGAGGTSGSTIYPSEGEAGGAGALGLGGGGAFIGGGQAPAPGGYNGGGSGGGYTTVGGGNTFIRWGGGGGGGGLNGGGGGGGVVWNTAGGAEGGGGGGGGANLVPAGGSASTDATGSPGITLSFEDSAAPIVSLNQPPARLGAPMTLSGASGTILGDGEVTIDVYAGASAQGAPVRSFVADRNATTGAFSGSPPPGLPDGTYTAQATQVDGANTVGVTAARTFVYDTTPPALSLTGPTAGSRTSNPTPVFTGVAGKASDESATVDVSVYAAGSNDVVRTLSGQRNASTGVYAIPASPALADATYEAVATQSDDAGNERETGRVRFTVDTQAPAPTLTQPADGGSSDATPTFAGDGGATEGDAGTVTVRVYAGNAPSGDAVATLQAELDDSGDYLLNDAVSLFDGTYTAQTSQSDAAGNTGTSAPKTFTSTGGGAGPDCASAEKKLKSAKKKLKQAKKQLKSAKKSGDSAKVKQAKKKVKKAKGKLKKAKRAVAQNCA
jgi:hypothetical protein